MNRGIDSLIASAVLIGAALIGATPTAADESDPTDPKDVATFEFGDE